MKIRGLRSLIRSLILTPVALTTTKEPEGIVRIDPTNGTFSRGVDVAITESSQYCSLPRHSYGSSNGRRRRTIHCDGIHAKWKFGSIPTEREGQHYAIGLDHDVGSGDDNRTADCAC